MVAPRAHCTPGKQSIFQVGKLAKWIMPSTSTPSSFIKEKYQSSSSNLKSSSDATSAQIYEGVSINHTPSAEGYLMNSKAEYQQGEVARVFVVRGLAE